MMNATVHSNEHREPVVDVLDRVNVERVVARAFGKIGRGKRARVFIGHTREVFPPDRQAAYVEALRAHLAAHGLRLERNREQLLAVAGPAKGDRFKPWIGRRERRPGLRGAFYRQYRWMRESQNCGRLILSRLDREPQNAVALVAALTVLRPRLAAAKPTDG